MRTVMNPGIRGKRNQNESYFIDTVTDTDRTEWAPVTSDTAR